MAYAVTLYKVTHIYSGILVLTDVILQWAFGRWI